MIRTHYGNQNSTFTANMHWTCKALVSGWHTVRAPKKKTDPEQQQKIWRKNAKKRLTSLRGGEEPGSLASRISTAVCRSAALCPFSSSLRHIWTSAGLYRCRQTDTSKRTCVILEMGLHGNNKRTYPSVRPSVRLSACPQTVFGLLIWLFAKNYVNSLSFLIQSMTRNMLLKKGTG